MKTISLSIVVPIGPGDQSWQDLLKNLGSILSTLSMPKVDIVLSYCQEDEELFLKQLGLFEEGKSFSIETIGSERGRSNQLNKGAQKAKGEFLWFLHADSSLEESSLVRLYQSLADDPKALHYFNLTFLEDGPFLTCLNEWGARIRSDALKMPFGDQGFCIKKDAFRSLGGFLPEGEKKGGEDHLFVWEARKNGLKLRNTGGFLGTSARKYQRNGWLQTTGYHLYLTYKVAIKQWLRLKRP